MKEKADNRFSEDMYKQSKVEDRRVDTIEGVERALKQRLGNSYDLAMENCYALLQVKCGMQEQLTPGNTFVSRDNGGQYRLTRYGFRAKERDQFLDPVRVPEAEVKKSRWKIFGL